MSLYSSYKNWSMERQSKTSGRGESADRPTSTENANESSRCIIGASTDPSSPAPYTWAQSLECLLSDIEGAELFKKFLEPEDHDSMCLSFLFACKGIKKNPPSNRKIFVSLIKTVYKKKVKMISAIRGETKEKIKKILSKSDVDDTIFDTAQREVEAYMMKTSYPNFLRSALYFQYLGRWQNEQSLKKERSIPPEPPDILPTVHEGAQLTLASNKISPTNANILPRNKISSTSKFKPEGPAVREIPVSSQSKQECAQTASNDDVISNIDGQGNHLKFIRHNKRLPDGPLTPEIMQVFHAVLGEKLGKFLEDMRIKEEKVTGKLKSVMNNDHLMSERASFSNSRASHQSNAASVIESVLSDENPQDILNRHISMNFGDSGEHSPVSGYTSPDDAVVDKPCVPVQGPSYWDRPHIPSHKHNQVSQYTVPNSIKYRRDHDTRSIDSAVFDYTSDDNVPSRSQNSSLVGNVESDHGKHLNKLSKLYPYSTKFSPMTASHSSFIDSGISLACDSSYSKSTSRSKNSYDTSRMKFSKEYDSCEVGSFHRSTSGSKNSYDTSRMKFSKEYDSCEDGSCHRSTSGGKTSYDTSRMKFSKGYDSCEDGSCHRSTSGSKNSYDTSRMKFSKGYDSCEDGSCHRKLNKKSPSSSTVEQVTKNTPCTMIAYSYGRDTVPYLCKFPAKHLTLHQLKSLVTKKGNFRYFFKTVNEDFGVVVLEEVTDDYKVLPLWEGKVFCVIEPMDDNSRR